MQQNGGFKKKKRITEAESHKVYQPVTLIQGKLGIYECRPSTLMPTSFQVDLCCRVDTAESDYYKTIPTCIFIM